MRKGHHFGEENGGFGLSRNKAKELFSFGEKNKDEEEKFESKDFTLDFNIDESFSNSRRSPRFQESRSDFRQYSSHYPFTEKEKEKTQCFFTANGSDRELIEDDDSVSQISFRRNCAFDGQLFSDHSAKRKWSTDWEKKVAVATRADHKAPNRSLRFSTFSKPHSVNFVESKELDDVDV
jgi:hypothetical protein